jgi:hypothetical protein
MHILSRLRLRTKLALLMGLSALTLIASLGLAASIIRQRMSDDRVDELRAVRAVRRNGGAARRAAGGLIPAGVNGILTTVR